MLAIRTSVVHRSRTGDNVPESNTVGAIIIIMSSGVRIVEDTFGLTHQPGTEQIQPVKRFTFSRGSVRVQVRVVFGLGRFPCADSAHQCVNPCNPFR